MTNKLVLYHDKCTDGFGAAFAAWLEFGDEAEYMAFNYGKMDLFERKAVLNLCTGRDVYILDFSFDRDLMEQIFAVAKHTTWLDHHKSAFLEYGAPFNDTARYIKNDATKTIILDNCRSGALLAYDTFHADKDKSYPSKLFRMIDDRDRWQFKLDGSRELHQALQNILPWSFDQWYDILDTHGKLDQMIVTGGQLLSQFNRLCDLAVERSAQCFLSKAGKGGRAANVQYEFASEVGNRLAEISGTYGLTWFVNKDSTVSCSIRSNGDYDVSCIAKLYGGGGHKNAAGFKFDSLEEFMSEVKL